MMSERERRGVLCRHHESATELTNSRSIWSCWAFSGDSAFVSMDAFDLRFALFFLLVYNDILLFQQISRCSLKPISAQFAIEQKRRWQ